MLTPMKRHDPAQALERVCSNASCRERNPQPIDRFSRQRSGRAGRRARCKACVAQYRLDNRARLRDYNRAWDRDNANRRRDAARSRRVADPRKTAIDAAAANAVRRFGGSVPEHRTVIEAVWDDPCHWCGACDASHVDHLSADDPLDVVKACPVCNRARGDWGNEPVLMIARGDQLHDRDVAERMLRRAVVLARARAPHPDLGEGSDPGRVYTALLSGLSRYPYTTNRWGSRANPLVVSLDRVNPGEGYSVSNTRAVPWLINFARKDRFSYDEVMRRLALFHQLHASRQEAA